MRPQAGKSRRADTRHHPHQRPHTTHTTKKRRPPQSEPQPPACSVPRHSGGTDGFTTTARRGGRAREGGSPLAPQPAHRQFMLAHHTIHKKVTPPPVVPVPPCTPFGTLRACTAITDDAATPRSWRLPASRLLRQ